MSMPKGAEVYLADAKPVIARGVSYTEEQLDEMLHGPIKDILTDAAGIASLQELLSTVVTTEFEQHGLQQLLGGDLALDNWRVGEAIAEGFIADHGKCIFPWPNS